MSLSASRQLLGALCVVFAFAEKMYGGDSGVVGWLIAAAGWMAASEVSKRDF